MRTATCARTPSTKPVRNGRGILNARIGQIEQRIRDLSLYTVNSIPRDAVGYGSQVTLENDDDGTEVKYQIVFPEEVNPSIGLISIGSPLGRALLNREVGDEVEVTTPKGRRKLPDRRAAHLPRARGLEDPVTAGGVGGCNTRSGPNSRSYSIAAPASDLWPARQSCAQGLGLAADLSPVLDPQCHF